MAIHELQLLLENHGLTVAESWRLIAYVVIALLGACGIFHVCLEQLEDWRAKRRREQDVADLLRKFPVTDPRNDRQLFDALMTVRRGPDLPAHIIPFDSRRI